MTAKRIFQIFCLGILGLIALSYLALVGLIKYDEFSSRNAIKDNLTSLSADSKEQHQILLLTSGVASFTKRLEIIRGAQKSIELEYFIYNLDRSSRILTKELIKKAKEGVKVRLIVDYSKPVFELDPFIAAFLKKSGIDVRYYNTAATWSLFEVQHRSHRKLTIVDGKYVITGGRNIADEYFELSPTYNFFDTDILIEGPIVEKIRDSFDAYWNSNLASTAEAFKTKFSEEELEKALDYLSNEKEEDGLLEKILETGRKDLSSSLKTTCSDISFITDFPGSSVGQRKVYPALLAEAQRAETNIFIESPYFVLKQEGLDDVKSITGRNVEVKVLTNSLSSTDAFYTVSALFSNLPKFNFPKIEVWGYAGTPRPEREHLTASPQWGLHSKRGVIDEKTTLIGTYNIDPRSANLNSELMVICRNNPELAQAVIQDFKTRIQNSKPIVQNDCSNCWSNTFSGADFWAKIKFIIAIPVANQLDFLL